MSKYKDDGIHFHPSSYWMFDEPCISIEIEKICDLPDEKILDAVNYARRNLEFLLEYSRVSGHFELYSDDDMYYWEHLGVERLEKSIQMFIKHIEEEKEPFGQVIAYTGALIRMRKKLLEKQNLKAHVKEMRRQFQRIRNDVYSQLVLENGERCNQCGATENIEVDHIIALKDWGDNQPGNFQLLCKTCNMKKGKQ